MGPCVQLFIILANCLVLFVASIQSAANMTQDERKQSEFLDNLFRNYDLRIRPNFNGPPVEVITDMFVSSMDSVQETTMSYTMDIFMRQQWNDPRLSFTEYNHSVSVHTQLLNRMWFPDLFFPNEKRAYQHDVTTDNKLLRLFPNGDILYSVRLLLTLTCMMSLQKFPMDRQQCAVQCESYGFTTKDLLFKWRDVEPIQRDSNLQLPQFDIVGTRTLLCTKQYNTGNYTCVEGRFIMTRQMGYYMIQTYIPSMLIVILSWVSFWISAESSPARVALGITTVLTMTTQSSGANETLPKVSYVKAIDIWMAVCLLFVFAALVEFAAANYKSRKKIGKADRQKRQKENKLSNENSENSTLLEMKPIQTYIKTDFKSMPSTVTSGAQLSDTEVKVVLHKPPETDWAQYIDYVSRVAFPVAFLLFNIVYWTMYMTWYFNPDDD